jgi:cysteinyl-tRNA synthetase
LSQRHRRVLTRDIQKKHRHSSNLLSSSSSNNHGYILEPNAGPIHPKCRLTENQIHILISKRQRCKNKRQYADADKILVALNQCGVYKHDKRKEWRADGKNYFGRRSDYVRRGSTHGLLSDADILAVETLVVDRSYAKKRGDFLVADELGDILRTKYRVKVDDKNREWSVENIAIHDGDNNGSRMMGIGEDYVPSPLCKLDEPTHTMDEETKMLIARRLAERAVYRKKRDYAMADKILDELMVVYSVIVDDGTKEWKVIIGDDLEYDRFVNGALLSQRSAYVRSGKNETIENVNKL